MRPISRVNDPLLAKAIQAEVKRRQGIAAKTLFDRTPQQLSSDRIAFYLDRVHAKQRAFLLDTHRYKALLCPRGTGKTTGTLYHVLMSAEKHPGSTIAYVVPDSKAHAKDLFWLPLKHLDEELHLGLQFKEVEKRVITPNGTNILLLAAHDKDSPTRLRGTPFSCVVLDECKDFGPHFETLVVEAVVPRLGDFDGTLILAGTPGDLLDGLFFRITTQKPDGWGVHTWVKPDNTFLPKQERDLQWIEEHRYKPFGLDRNSAKFRREQLAEWVAEDSQRGYMYDPCKNAWDGELNPIIEYDYICGIDIGKKDATVFVIMAFSSYDPNLYVVEAHAFHPMHIQEIADTYDGFNQRYEFVSTVADCGGLGVLITDDINHRYGFNWKPAEKKQKASYVAQMNSDFIMGRIKCEESSILAKAWCRSVKDPKTMLPLHSDEGDAALYAWRESLHWTGAYSPVPPVEGSPEYWYKREQEMVAKAVDRKKSGSNTWRAPSDAKEELVYE